MVHVNQPGMSLANTVVIPHIDHHEPKLRIPTGAVTNAEEPFVKALPQKDGFYTIALRDRKFRIENTRGMFSDKPPFLAVAPPLLKLTPQCTLREEVKARTLVPNDLISYIDYWGGRVRPIRYYPKVLDVEESVWAGPPALYTV